MEDLPPEVVRALSEAMAARDPQAEVRLRLVCPACGSDRIALLDVVTFLWTGIRTRAERLMREVSDLARAYGWSETDILSMSPARRRFYLEAAQR